MGVMLITAIMSMFMSNTATTATMFAVMMPVIMALPEGKARTGIALSIPVAANVGGMGTPVGTPPNAIALGALENAGIKVTFFQWMLAAVPLMLVLLVLSWAFIAWRYIPSNAKFDIDTSARFEKSKSAIIFYAVAGLTILLWMTESLHHISSNIVGFLPVVILLMTKVMSGDDLRALDWPVLWLVAGGIALGSGVSATGLDKWMLGSIQWASIPGALLILVLALVGWVTSNVISHSASANLLVPMGMGLAATVSTGAAEIAMVIALGCSLGMCLPISTPPNAIAYSTGRCLSPQPRPLPRAHRGLLTGGRKALRKEMLRFLSEPMSAVVGTGRAITFMSSSLEIIPAKLPLHSRAISRSLSQTSALTASRISTI